MRSRTRERRGRGRVLGEEEGDKEYWGMVRRYLGESLYWETVWGMKEDEDGCMGPLWRRIGMKMASSNQMEYKNLKDA